MKKSIKPEKVNNAIIFSAGTGSRCVPLTYYTPKGLLKVRGIPLIERSITQLLESGITEIIIVVGYMKEQFEYLSAKYGVKLVYNPEYAIKNNLSSLHCVLDHLGSSYIVLSDNWLEKNIYKQYENQSWASCAYEKGPTKEWCVTTSSTSSASSNQRIQSITVGGQDSYTMVGPAYFSSSFSALFAPLVREYYHRAQTENFYWEDVLKQNLEALPIYINDQTDNAWDLDDLDTIKSFDPGFLDGINNPVLHNPVLHNIKETLNTPINQISDVKPVKMGLTNDSFRFSAEGKDYIYRVPGTGTDKLLNRNEEHEVYQTIVHLKISENILFFDPKTGHKISEFLNNSRVCDPYSPDDVEKCMSVLRKFHEQSHKQNLKVKHTFDIFKKIALYESLWAGHPPYFDDYETTKAHIIEMKPFIDSCDKEWGLTHVDPVYANFLFTDTGGDEEIRLIDWEYAGMQDVHLDIAMFSIYALYPKHKVEELISIYFKEPCPPDIRTKIYAYIAVCGFMWFCWCEYQRKLGIKHGKYALQQYQYAKDYYCIWKETAVSTPVGKIVEKISSENI